MAPVERTDPPQDDLVRRLAGGDAEALAQLFEPYAQVIAARVRRSVPASVLRKVSVSDILQEIRLVALERCRDFEDRGPGSMRNWLLTIADMKIHEFVRRHAGTAKRDAAREVTHGRRGETKDVPARGASPSQHAIAAELAVIARRALEALPPEQAEVLRLVRDEHLTLREAAERVGKSREAVKKIYGRGLLRLKREFERLGGSLDGKG
jgi:RNA polymerase sigma-70 factor (ECF subfamily)